MGTGRKLLSFLLPGALISIALIGASLHPQLAPILSALSPLFAYTMVLVALLLGWRFDRSRLVFATVIIALGGGLLLYAGQRPDATARIIVDAVTTLLPLNLALIALLKERGIFSWHGMLRWGFILAQPLGIALLIQQQQYFWLGIFDTPLLPIAALEHLDLRQPALLALLIALGISLYQSIRLQNPIEHGLFWAVLLCGYALIFVDAPALRLVLLAGAVLILIITVIELSYSMAYHDELTGLPGRRALNHALLKLGGRYTIAMLDVDHFKKFNDTYGHDIGDEVLKMVAVKMGKVSGSGKAFRYGGEEFSVVFPGKSLRDALPHLETIREAIATTDFTVRSAKRPKQKPEQAKNRGSKTVRVTISIGAAERDEAARDPQAVIKAADKALYRAKKAGRNCVVG